MPKGRSKKVVSAAMSDAKAAADAAAEAAIAAEVEAAVAEASAEMGDTYSIGNDGNDYGNDETATGRSAHSHAAFQRQQQQQQHYQQQHYQQQHYQQHQRQQQQQQQQHQRRQQEEEMGACRICGKGGEDGRAMCRFSPLNPPSGDDATSDSAVSDGIVTPTCTEDITLHVFCGKTASILPSINMPQYEILTKAGIKNKHGIGPDVNAAITRTRFAAVPGSGDEAAGKPDKTFYLVKEFEANLALLRGYSAAQQHHLYLEQQQLQQFSFTPMPNPILAPPPPAASPAGAASSFGGQLPYSITMPPLSTDPTSAPAAASTFSAQKFLAPDPGNAATHKAKGAYKEKPIPAKAAAGNVTTKNKPQLGKGRGGGGNSATGEWTMVEAENFTSLTPDGKVRCECGGTHLPTGTARGAASWRSHIMTKKHQKWMEEHF